MLTPYEKHVVKILVKKNIISHQQAEECLVNFQELIQQGKSTDYLTILKQKGYIDEEQLILIAEQNDTLSGDSLIGSRSGITEVENFQSITKDHPSFILKGTKFLHYRIEKKLGEGGMGVVHKAYDSKLHRYVAIKAIQSNKASEIAKQRFFKEARALASLSHPNIIQVYEIGEDPQNYFIMEYVEGKTLGALIQTEKLSLKKIVHITKQCASALHEAHKKGIIHRDIKPSNIMVNSKNQPKVMDFGLIKDLKDSQKLSSSGDLTGTVIYMSPEQANGEDLTIHTDIYSLGATLYHAVTKKPPVSGPNTLAVLKKILYDRPIPLTKIDATIPKKLESICLKCLEKDPKKRYANMMLLAKDLHNFQQGKAISIKSQNSLSISFYRAAIAIVALLFLAWGISSLNNSSLPISNGKNPQNSLQNSQLSSTEIPGNDSKQIANAEQTETHKKELMKIATSEQNEIPKGTEISQPSPENIRDNTNILKNSALKNVEDSENTEDPEKDTENSENTENSHTENIEESQNTEKNAEGSENTEDDNNIKDPEKVKNPENNILKNVDPKKGIKNPKKNPHKKGPKNPGKHPKNLKQGQPEKPKNDPPQEKPNKKFIPRDIEEKRQQIWQALFDQGVRVNGSQKMPNGNATLSKKRYTKNYRGAKKYSGKFENGAPIGSGIVTWYDGRRWRGEFTLHQLWLFFLPDIRVYEHWQDIFDSCEDLSNNDLLLPEGEITITFSKQTTYSGKFQRGIPQGTGLWKFQQYQWQGEFLLSDIVSIAEGYYHSIEEDYDFEKHPDEFWNFLYENDATVMISRKKNHLPHGKVKLIYPSGATFRGNFEDGYPVGDGTLQWKDGRKWQGYFTLTNLSQFVYEYESSEESMIYTIAENAKRGLDRDLPEERLPRGKLDVFFTNNTEYHGEISPKKIAQMVFADEEEKLVWQGQFLTQDIYFLCTEVYSKEHFYDDDEEDDEDE